MHMVSHQAVGIQRKPAELLTIRKALQELFAVLVSKLNCSFNQKTAMAWFCAPFYNTFLKMQQQGGTNTVSSLLSPKSGVSY